jgi:hypothetical protein
MTLLGYVDILNTVVKPWLEAKEDFVLEEDGDSGHGTGPKNIVHTWKQDHGLKSYFNCHDSLDLAPIEKAWQPPKQYIRKFPHWDKEETQELAKEGWDKVSHDFINKWVDSMPQRLREVIEMDGKMTAH